VSSIREDCGSSNQGEQSKSALPVIEPIPENPEPEAHHEKPGDHKRPRMDKRFVVDALTLGAIIVAAIVYYGQLREMKQANDLTQEALSYSVRISPPKTRNVL